MPKLLIQNFLFPPVTGPLPRQAPVSGAVVCGRHVAENMVVAVCHWVMNYSERNFLNPEQFRPERWLEDRNEIELKDLQPFSLGPRICVAKEYADGYPKGKSTNIAYIVLHWLIVDSS